MSRMRYRSFADTNPHDDLIGNVRKETPARTETGWVRVDDIIVPKSCNRLDKNVPNAIAESFPLTGGILQPLLVRRRRSKKNGRTQIQLISGVQRLHAAGIAEQKYVPVIYIPGDSTDARLARCIENLCRKRLTVLEQAELLMEGVQLAEKKGFIITGQVGRKSGVGRPSSGDSRLARELPILGRTLEGRRKVVGRARAMASIAVEAKDAAKVAHLDDNQDALLKIAKKKGREAQLKVVKALAPSVQGPSEAPAGEDAIPSSPKLPGRRFTAPTTTSEMNDAWEKHCKRLFINLPAVDRVAFIEMLRNSPSKVGADAVALVRNVFTGRKKVYGRELFAYCQQSGFSKKQIRKVLKECGYRQKRNGRGVPAYYINMDGTEGFLRNLSDALFRMPYETAQIQQTANEPKQAISPRDPYYEI